MALDCTSSSCGAEGLLGELAREGEDSLPESAGVVASVPEESASLTTLSRGS